MSTAEWRLRSTDGNDAGDAAQGLSGGLSAKEKKYLALLTDYCLLAKLNDPHAALTGEEFVVDGIDFRLIYLPERQPDILGVWCDFGEMPAYREEQCYRDLLQLNATRYDGISPIMSLCQETGMVICSARLPLHALSAAALHELICAMAKEARQWQSDMWKN
jgi:Tir chaperone protein (CesT) family